MYTDFLFFSNVFVPTIENREEVCILVSFIYFSFPSQNYYKNVFDQCFIGWYIIF